MSLLQDDNKNDNKRTMNQQYGPYLESSTSIVSNLLWWHSKDNEGVK